MTANTSLLSVEQIARLLGVHVRTVRRYLRHGALAGVRIGKQYRVTTEALAAFTGQPVPTSPATTQASRHVEVSTIVHIDAVSPDEAIRLSNGVGGAVRSRGHASGSALRVDTIYDEERRRLKLIILGDLAGAAGMMQLIETYVGVHARAR